MLSYLTLKGGSAIGKAGIEFSGSAPTLLVDGCTIVSNYYGVYNIRLTVQTITLRNTLIARNSSKGLYFRDQPPQGYYCYLYNCTVADNGGDGYCAVGTGDGQWSDAAPVAKNTLFTGNNGYGVYKGGGTVGGSLEYCLFHGNTNGATNVYYVADLGNNLTNSPLYYDKWGIRSYRLWQTSPAHNTGTNLATLGLTLDIEGVARPDGVAFDRGAYERALPVFPGTVFVVH